MEVSYLLQPDVPPPVSAEAFLECRQKSVLILDRCAFRRESLHLMLGSYARDFSVESVSAICSVAQQQYGAIILSIDGTDETGTHACADLAVIRSTLGDVPVALFGGAELVPLAYRLIREGFNGIFLMSLEVDLVIAGLRLICAGGTFVPRGAIDRSDPPEITANLDEGGLTRREQQILACVGEGMQNKIIAHQLGISESTVKVHLQRIMRKMGATNRTEVALRATRKHL